MLYASCFLFLASCVFVCFCVTDIEKIQRKALEFGVPSELRDEIWKLLLGMLSLGHAPFF